MDVVPIVRLPRMAPEQRIRPPQTNIPQTKLERDRVAAMVRQYVARHRVVPPLSVDELRAHADAVAAIAGAGPEYRDYIAVLVNNESWHDVLAGIPFERRLLLLPKCLRHESKCPAPFDEFGLLCKRCGLCSIQDLQDEAERLGYAVLVAEGSAIVTAIIETGKIEAIVGVSCLSVLERAFPFMEAAAIPGIAIPLLQDDCVDTTVDLDWIWDVIHLTSDDRTYRMDLDAIRADVDGWFTAERLTDLMGPIESETDEIARQWLAKSGKRWRPFLSVCAYAALKEAPDVAPPKSLQQIAVAVECFHKASLIHDDIEDGDATRYGDQTLHEALGVPVALNVGDFLIGEGYRLLADLDAPAAVKVELLQIAANGHRTLSRGQGTELCWARAPRTVSSLDVLDVFRRKTAPAFEVALRLGSALARADDTIHDALARYSEALGIAYQIRDELEDEAADASTTTTPRPSLLLAVGRERAGSRAAPETVDLLSRACAGQTADLSPAAVRAALVEVGASDRCRRLFESYKDEAIRSLVELENASLKGLLRRVVGKIFNDLELKGWCSEFETRNAAGRAAGTEAPV
jgi:geranylgeranyl diphosphate synthase type II